MDTYIGVKIVKAKPMNRLDYNEYRGWDLPSDEDGADEGYLVEYPDGESNHKDHQGYVSWCPKEQFENANRPTDGMSFGHAIEAMRKGEKVARLGWNGKGIYIFLIKDIDEIEATFEGKEPFELELGSFIAIDTTGLQSDNDHAPRSIVPWLASQTDMLARDWMIV